MLWLKTTLSETCCNFSNLTLDIFKFYFYMEIRYGDALVIFVVTYGLFSWQDTDSKIFIINHLDILTFVVCHQSPNQLSNNICFNCQVNVGECFWILVLLRWYVKRELNLYLLWTINHLNIICYHNCPQISPVNDWNVKPNSGEWGQSKIAPSKSTSIKLDYKVWVDPNNFFHSVSRYSAYTVMPIQKGNHLLFLKTEDLAVINITYSI